MKRTIIYVLTTLVFLGSEIRAQDVYRQKVRPLNVYRLKVQGDVTSLKVEISNLASEINIEGHSSDEIVIEAAGYRGIPEKAKGLKPLSAFGEDNTEIGLYVNQKGNVIEIAGVSRASNDTNYLIKIPERMKLKINSDHWNAEDIEVEGMKNEVEIKANSSNIDLENVTGPLVLNALNCEISITLSSLGQAGPSSITSTNGDIDITMPGNSKGNFILSCFNGEIYTNLEMDLDEKSEENLRRIGGGMRASGKTNGGGVEVTIHALNGNIYLRGN